MQLGPLIVSTAIDELIAAVECAAIADIDCCSTKDDFVLLMIGASAVGGDDQCISVPQSDFTA